MIPEAKLSTTSIVVRSDEQVTGALDNESVVLSTKTWKYYAFNGLGDQVWTALETPQRVSQICEVILSQYKVEREQCEQDVIEFIEGLLEIGLAEITQMEDGS